MSEHVEQRTLVVVPTYNEHDNIESLIEQLLALPVVPDVLVVDDASPDDTAQVVLAASTRNPHHVHLLTRPAKGGRGSAVLAGFAWGLARGYEALCEMDADWSHDPATLPKLVAALADADVVIGSRYVRGGRIIDWSIVRRVFSRLANVFARWRLKVPINDYTSGYRAYRGTALELLDAGRIEAHGHIVLSAVAVQLHRKGMRFIELPIVFRGRRHGQSNLSFGVIVEAWGSVSRLAAADRQN